MAQGNDRTALESEPHSNALGSMSIDVEDWFHILDSPAAPRIEAWEGLESRIDPPVNALLEMLDRTGVRATFFWLGWIAERHPDLVRRCQDAGHEVASHGYGHVLAYKMGEQAFEEDVRRAKDILEQITGERVVGFRAPGFGITDDAGWAFDVIRRTGHTYDSSVFPASRGHGGLLGSPIGPYTIETPSGPLLQLPMSVVPLGGKRLALFGGGYLRLAPRWLIRWGIGRLQKMKQPLIVYVHPREVDPAHPRLPLSPVRRFKCYVNLRSTMGKLEWLCRTYQPGTMRDLVNSLGDVSQTVRFGQR